MNISRTMTALQDFFTFTNFKNYYSVVSYLLQKAVPHIFWAHLEGVPSYQLDTAESRGELEQAVRAGRNGWNPFLKGFQYRRLKSVPPRPSLVMSTNTALGTQSQAWKIYVLHCIVIDLAQFWSIKVQIYFMLHQDHLSGLSSFSVVSILDLRNCFNMVSIST